MSVERLRRRAAGILVLVISAMCVLVGVTRAAAWEKVEPFGQVEAIPGLLAYTVDDSGTIYRVRPDGDLARVSDWMHNSPARDVAVGDDGYMYAISGFSPVIRYAPDGTTATFGWGQLTDTYAVD